MILISEKLYQHAKAYALRHDIPQGTWTWIPWEPANTRWERMQGLLIDGPEDLIGMFSNFERNYLLRRDLRRRV